MKAKSSGAVQSFVSLGFLRNYLFPLPPLSEQKRIVAKIDQLMELCNTLGQQINDSDKEEDCYSRCRIGKVVDKCVYNQYK